jgi:hypothetical protein
MRTIRLQMALLVLLSVVSALIVATEGWGP